jgi:phospholipid/cholesterol/gamma-HCH transport system substrate-binding protein
MSEGFSQKEKIVGLFFLVLVTLTNVALILISQEKGWLLSRRTYLVKFPEGYNLQVGSPVKMFDAEIGKVSKIEIDKKNRSFPVIVTVNILKDYSELITEDSEAYVVSPLFIGTVYLTITAGSTSYKPLPDHHVIPTGYHLSMTERLASLINEQNLSQVKTMLANLGQMSEQLKNDEKAFFTAVDAFKQVAVNLNTGKGTLGQLATNRELYTRLNESVNQLNKVLADARKVTGELQPAAQSLQEIAQGVKVEVKTLNSILGDIKGGSKAFPALMETATETMQATKEVVDALKANPLIRLTSPKQPQSQPVHVDPRDVP